MGCWPLVLKILAALAAAAGVAASNHHLLNPSTPLEPFEPAPEEAIASAGSTTTTTAGSVLLVGYRPGAPATEAPPAGEPVNYAELCYLSNGGSSLTLTVNEATQVGALVGTVEVNGNPALDATGNVDLVDGPGQSSSGLVVSAAPPLNQSTAGGLEWSDWSRRSSQRRRLLARRQVNEEPPAPVRLEPGTKNLVLVRALDREALEGEPALVLQGAPYQVNVSETSAVGQVVAAARHILALDRDSAGPFSTIHYRVLEEPGAPTPVLQFANPLEPVLVLAAPLDYETQASYTLTLVAQDQGEPEPLSSSVQLQVNVIDFDDQNPRFLDDKYSLLMDESQRAKVGQRLQVLPRPLRAEDGDRGINAPLVYSLEPASANQSLAGQVLREPRTLLANARGEDDEAALKEPPRSLPLDHYLDLEPSSGELRLIREWPARWPAAPLTLVVRATQADNRDRYTLTTLTISAALGAARDHLEEPTPTSGGPLRFATRFLEVSVPESAQVGEQVVARLKAHLESEADNSPPAATINYQILDDQAHQWQVNGRGELLLRRPLDAELRRLHRFRVLATHSKHSDVCQLQVNVLNVNDNRPKPHYSFHLTEPRLRNNLLGSVQAHDADLNDSIRYSLVGGQHAHLFHISPTTGQLSLKPSTRHLDTSPCELVVEARDTLGEGPHHSHQARVHVQVAPHLLGNHVDLTLIQGAGDSPVDLVPIASHDARLFNSRSLLQQHRQQQQQQTANRKSDAAKQDELGWAEQRPAGQQRSSVATVMSSMQHMLRGAGFLDMPWASALLLSALLAFMVCLLLVLIATMSVHLYKRRSKARHHQVSASLRQVRRSPAPPRAGSSSSSASSPRFLSDVSRGAGNGGPRLSLSGTPQLHLSPTASQQQQQQHPGSTLRRPNLDSLSRRPPHQQHPQAASIPPPPHSVSMGPLELSMEAAAVVGCSLSSQSKRSYRSNSTDDSSVIHCGHYSVNSPAAARFRSDAHSPNQQLHLQLQHQQQLQLRKQPLQHQLEPGACRAYRKLPHLSSLVRASRCRVGPAKGDGESAHQTDSAIASDGSSSGPGAGSERRPAATAGHLMALIRSPTSHSFPAPAAAPVGSPANPIKWPSEAAPPQRVKRLTWDLEETAGDAGAKKSEDEDEDCFIAADIQLEGPISPLSNHQYPVQGATDTRGHHYAEQHFLFSAPSSPANSSGPLPATPVPASQLQHQTPLTDNCLDYTFVQQQQQHFGPDSLAAQKQSLSAQHHHLQQQQQQQQLLGNYLYSNQRPAAGARDNRSTPSPPAQANQALLRTQDLRLLTTAAI